jgi:hypothetical protein
MKIIELFALFIVIGLILAGGCVAMTNKNTENITTAAPFSPHANVSDHGLNTTANVTDNSTSKLKGSLRVSISGILYPANLSVVLDNETVGTVTPSTPLYLMVPEGNHTVIVCVSPVCEQEQVTTRFGKYVSVDFSEQLLKDVKFPNPNAEPTARILDCYKNGDEISVNVEFFNPSPKDLRMSVIISVGYSYIDDRTNIKMGDSAKGVLVQDVRAGQRITKPLTLSFASGHSFTYNSPVIEELKIK